MKFVHITATQLLAPRGHRYGSVPKARPDAVVAEQAQFAEVIAPHRTHVRQLFLRPAHRPIADSWQGISFSTQDGTNHQICSEQDPAVLYLANHDPAAYAIVLVTPDAMVAHVDDYPDRRAPFPFGKYGVDDRAYAFGPAGSSA